MEDKTTQRELTKYKSLLLKYNQNVLEDEDKEESFRKISENIFRITQEENRQFNVEILNTNKGTGSSTRMQWVY